MPGKDDLSRPPKQPRRVSNSFSKEELEVLAAALQRSEDFRQLPGGFVGRDYEALSQVMQTALRGGDITGLVRSCDVRQALTKLEGLKNVMRAEITLPEEACEAQTTVTERVTKMLARARLAGVIQAEPAEERPCV